MARLQRGLTIPARFAERDGPVLAVEGASDVLAATAMGIAAIGRPSNMGGVDLLVDVLRDVPPDRPIIVLGEYDANSKGQWPGRDGAIQPVRAANSQATS